MELVKSTEFACYQSLTHGYADPDYTEFHSSLLPLTRAPMDPFTEAAASALDIEMKAQAPIELCLSGGVDSEAMALAFLDAKVKFTVTILKFDEEWNDFDINYAYQFCEKHNLAYRTLRLDVLHFFESGRHLYYGKHFRCQSPQLAVHLWLLDQIKGVPVLAGNPIAPIFRDNEFYFMGLPHDLHSVYFRYFDASNRQGFPWFFLHTPELLASFLRLPSMKPFCEKEHSQPEDYTYQIKCQSYQEGGFNIKARPDKFTGFEKLRAHYDKLDGKTHGIAFNDRFRAPLETLHPLPKVIKQYVPKCYF